MSDKLTQAGNNLMLTNPYINPFGFAQHAFNPNMAPNELDSPIVKYVIDKNSKGSSENIGNYKVTKLDENKYSVALTNGNLGARICTKAEVDALRKQEEELLIQQQKAFENYGKAQVNMQK